jgi:hypothetical protein
MRRAGCFDEKRAMVRGEPARSGGAEEEDDAGLVASMSSRVSAGV